MTSSRISISLCLQEDMIKLFQNRCWYSTWQCLIMASITKIWHGRIDFHEKWRFFWKSSNFKQAIIKLYLIILSYGNPPRSSYEIFWHRKCTVATENSCGTLVDQQTHQNWLQIWNLRILKYTRPLWLFLRGIFFDRKSRKPCTKIMKNQIREKVMK